MNNGLKVGAAALLVGIVGFSVPAAAQGYGYGYGGYYEPDYAPGYGYQRPAYGYGYERPAYGYERPAYGYDGPVYMRPRGAPGYRDSARNSSNSSPNYGMVDRSGGYYGVPYEDGSYRDRVGGQYNNR